MQLGDASSFSGSGEGLLELAVEVPAVLRAFQSENFEYSGAPQIDHLSTEILLKILRLGVKSPSSRGGTFRQVTPPPLAA